MKNFILPIICVLFMSSFAIAQTVDLSNLPEQTKQEIMQKVQQTNPQSLTPENVSKWAEVGKSVGVAIGATARELNVEVNAFASSPVGKFAMFLLAWNFFISDLFNTAICLAMLIFGMYLMWRIYHNRYEYEYENVPYFWGAFSVRKVKSSKLSKNYEDDAYWVYFTAAIVFTVVSVLATLISMAN